MTLTIDFVTISPLKERPNDPETRGLHASYMLDEGGDKREIIRGLTDVIRAVPGNFVARFNLGRAYFASYRYEEADAQFGAALKIRPDYRPALKGHVQLDLRNAAYEDPCIDSASVAKDPQNAQALEQQKILDDRH